MGHHFVPQKYLKGFQSLEKADWIWAFDKKLRTAKHLPINKVAQATGFYDTEIETSLTYDVEVPGYKVIEKILRGEVVSDDPTDEDRKDLSYYIATLIRRVPHSRAKGYKLVPETVSEVTQKFMKQFKDAAKVGWIDESTLNAWLAEVEAFGQKALTHIPEELRKIIETPWPSESVLLAIHNMHWRVLHCKGPSFYLTSDNPAYFFEGFGLAHDEAELILPLSNEVLLHCSRQDAKGRAELDITEWLVKEMNRRIASGADRFVFYHKDANWIHTAAMKQSDQLTRIRWNN